MTGGSQTAETPEISVVIACDGGIDGLEERLQAIAITCTGLDAEIIVVLSDAVAADFPVVRRVQFTQIRVRSDLVPVMWGAGIASARGRVVALTTTQFRVGREWAKELLSALENRGLAGVGGRMVVKTTATLLTRAAFLIRYSEHMGNDAADMPRDIAGDNAAYVRNTIVTDYPSVAAGFWEVDTHRIMRSKGRLFGRAPAAVAEFDPAFSLSQMITNRFVHGGHFGSYRVNALGWPRWRAVAVTPLVPFVLMARIAGRVGRSSGGFIAMAAATPYMIVLLVAWAAGEAHGAISAASHQQNDAR